MPDADRRPSADPEMSPEPERSARPSLDSLPLVGLTRRRIALLVAGLVAIWLIGIFSRQVADASAAAGQAAQMQARNEAVAADVASLQQELQLVERPAYVNQAARGYGLGSPGEIPFTVDPSAPPLPSNAPGSSGVATPTPEPLQSPLQAWLQALFGAQP